MSTVSGSRVTVPAASTYIVAFWHTALGSMLSSIVTDAEHVETFPLLSSTVKTTVFKPALEQSKSVTSIPRFAIPHTSSEPLSI